MEVKGVRKELLSNKPMPSIMRSLSGLSVDDIIGSDERTGMSYDDIFNIFNIWRKSEAARRRELRASKRAGVSPRAISSSRSRKIKDIGNDSVDAYRAAMTILTLQDEIEIDKEIDDDALRNEEECKEDYIDPPPTITTIPDGFTPVKKNETKSSVPVPVPVPVDLFGRKNDGSDDDGSDDEFKDFMKNVESYN